MRKYSLLIAFLSVLLAFFIFYRSSQLQEVLPIDVLYHGSITRNIKVFEPRSHHRRDEEEGAVVFATPSLKLASCYLFRWDDSWVHQSITWKEGNQADYRVVMVISDKTRFEQADSGGSLYILPASGFSFDEKKGLGVFEWTSKQKVFPLGQINFSSALEAMQEFGVDVYFIDQENHQEKFKHYLTLPGEEQEDFLVELRGRKIKKEGFKCKI